MHPSSYHPGSCTGSGSDRALCLAHTFSLMKDAISQWEHFETHSIPAVIASGSLSSLDISISNQQHDFLRVHKRFYEAISIHGLPFNLVGQYDEIVSKFPKFLVAFNIESGETTYRPLIVTSYLFTFDGCFLPVLDDRDTPPRGSYHLVMLSPCNHRF